MPSLPISPADLHRVRWDDLRILLAVSDAGSFRAGAASAKASLNTCRSAIDRLEYIYGEPMVERSVTGVTLTERGQAISSAARNIRDAIASA